MGAFDISGQVAIVTGAGQGIGRALATGLARAGASVAGVDLQQDKLKELEAELCSTGSPCATFALDLRDVKAFAAAVDSVKERWGHVDLLCNIAGVNLHKDSVDVTEEEWDFVLDVNLKALFFCCQAAARAMIPQKRGKIINMSSTFGVVGFPQRAAYCASKGAVSLLTKALAVEWAPHGITVNAIAPAAVFTPARAQLFSDPAFMENLLRRLPLGRLAQVEDVVNAALYLASPAADFVTGHVLMVDGGWTAI
ncbi:MAG: glucose 1-dehydrogenase [Acetobacteraceae bacterium]|nr:glucose 1-dehydrogenase [Acetobacteraceae bacterium]